MKNKDIISFFIKHPEYFIGMISSQYPFTKAQLIKYGGMLDWFSVSSNTKIAWTYELIDLFADNISWPYLTTNPSAFRDLSLLDTFSDRIDWKGHPDAVRDSITVNDGLPWSEDFIEKIESKIDIVKLSYSHCIPWTEQLIDKYINHLDLVELGCNESVPWTLFLFDKYLDTSYFYCYSLKGNRTLLGNFDFVEKYKDSLDWQDICSNDILPWYEKDLLNYWRKHIDWSGIARNELFFKRDKDFFRKHINMWAKDKALIFGELSCNKSVNWSLGLIDEYKTFWNWENLSANEGLPWSIDFIDHFSDKLKWGGWLFEGMHDEFGNFIPQSDSKHMEDGLILNQGLPWSIDFLKYYESELEFEALMINGAAWEKAFAPYLDDELVETTLRII